MASRRSRLLVMRALEVINNYDTPGPSSLRQYEDKLSDSGTSPAHDSIEDPRWSPEAADFTSDDSDNEDDPPPDVAALSSSTPGSSNGLGSVAAANLFPPEDTIQDDPPPDVAALSSSTPGSSNGLGSVAAADLFPPEDTIQGDDSGTRKKLFVCKSSTKSDKKRVWDKRDHCIFCEESPTNISRHFIRHHAQEMEVAKVLAMKKGSIERRRGFEALRKKGNFFHNKTCFLEKKGAIIVEHRPKSEADPESYLPCKFCFGFFSSTRLYRHIPKCSSNPGNEMRPGRNAKAVGNTLLMTTAQCDKNLKEKVLQKMKADSITSAVRDDRLICDYGTRMMKNHKDQHMGVLISQKMRELARLLLVLKKNNPEILNLENVIKPEHYEKIVNGVKELAGYDETSHTYKTASLATKLGHSLKACADILHTRGLILGETNLQQSANNFNAIMVKEWQFDVSSSAASSLYKGKWNKPMLLPLAEDLTLLRQYVESKEKEFSINLKLNPNETNWRDLSEATLAHIILLNRRRAGEAQRIEVEHYTNRSDAINADISEALSSTEKVLCKSLTRFETRGKRARRVPVLLTKTMKENFELLLHTRDIAGVMLDNPYFFALPHSPKSTLRGCTVLAKYASQCGAKDPKSITSTRLRKHVATMSQILSLNDNDLEQLATFMGHNVAVHRDYYRLPESTLQVAKVSKVLLALEEGKMNTNQGINLDNVDLNIDLGDDNNPSSDDESDVDRVDDQRSTVPVTEKTKFVPVTSDEGRTELVPENVKVKAQKRRKSSQRRKWTQDEQYAAKSHFAKHILLKKVPNKSECEQCLLAEPVLNSRTWSNLKFFVKNMFYP